ncbi:MAG: hypothetical protein ACFFG0_26850 [Candidatus Thorarchaeota archaeon]
MKVHLHTKLIIKSCINKFNGYGIGKLLPFQFILPYLKSYYIEIQGHKMFLDSSDSLNLSICRIYERSETELVKRIKKKATQL